MRNIILKPAAILLGACMLLTMSACSMESFYQLFVDEDDTSTGIYSVIYDADSTDDQIASIPDFPFVKGDLRDEIAAYDLSYEITLAFDTETENDATLTLYYYHNRDDEDADDYCMIGYAALGTYTQEDNVIRFVFEPEGYNIAICLYGADYEGLEAFEAFSYDEDGAAGIWAYANATYEYEDTAQILEDVVENLPAAMNFTTSGNTLVDWEAEEEEP